MTEIPGGRLRILALMPDAYHGFGGISQYNRDLLDSLCTCEAVESIQLISRLIPESAAAVPAKITEEHAPGNPARYAWRAWVLARRLHPELIVCGHINLLPVAVRLRTWFGGRLMLELYGVDVWERHRQYHPWMAREIDMAVSISRYTLERFAAWSYLRPSQLRILPNAIDLGRYRMADKPVRLIESLGLRDRRILLTLGRIESSERYKGHREIIGLLPRLREIFPDLVYVIAGSGNDVAYLRSAADEAGVRDHVVFAGRIPSADVVDLYNLADAFAMPSTGEGFGFVFLEAAACGVPVLGGRVDGSRDALRDGLLGAAVDPRDTEELFDGLVAVLGRGRRPNREVEAFRREHFARHVHALLAGMFPDRLSDFHAH